MQAKERQHVIIAGQFPPPVHGFSYITKQMADALAQQYETEIIDLIPRRYNKGPLYHASRLILAVRGVLTIISRRIAKGVCPVYIACEGGVGLIYTIILSTAARLSGQPVTLHHHSFNYVDRFYRPMDVLLKILGGKETHIFLCSKMASKFTSRYSSRSKTIILSNAAFVAVPTQPVKEFIQGQKLKIGLISNLNEEKGLSLFIQTVRLAIKDGLNVQGVLAEPAASHTDSVTIQDARKELGDALDYRGALYGEDKEKFFGEIDVFVFPTQYFNEAQPTVIAEAMSYGVPVLSYDRGCICDQVDSCGAVFDRERNFPESAVEWLSRYSKSCNDLNTLKQKTREQFLADRAIALATVNNLFIKDAYTS